jgi:hypothetical protein
VTQAVPAFRINKTRGFESPISANLRSQRTLGHLRVPARDALSPSTGPLSPNGVHFLWGPRRSHGPVTSARNKCLSPLSQETTSRKPGSASSRPAPGDSVSREHEKTDKRLRQHRIIHRTDGFWLSSWSVSVGVQLAS